jgi:hypothetical protein
VKTKFAAKAAANSAWVEVINAAVDSCWTDVQSKILNSPLKRFQTNFIADAPAPTPPPGAPAPPADKPQCSHKALFLVQCVQRNLVLV